MGKTKPGHRFRWKLGGYAAAALAAGIGLLILSQVIKSDVAAKNVPRTTAPAEKPPPAGNKQASSQNLSGLLLLFSTAALILAAVFVGWIIYDVRSSRPAWQRQSKYPKKR